MSGDSRKSWVAFDADGEPYGFAIYHDKRRKTIAQASKDFPDATRIELLDEAEWRVHLNRFCESRVMGTDQ
jgi:hypothetical protein